MKEERKLDASITVHSGAKREVERGLVDKEWRSGDVGQEIECLANQTSA